MLKCVICMILMHIVLMCCIFLTKESAFSGVQISVRCGWGQVGGVGGEQREQGRPCPVCMRVAE